VRIEHREPTVSVHLSITMDGKPSDARFERPSEWDGETLLFTDIIQTPDGEMTIVFRWCWPKQDNVWVFDRAGQPQRTSHLRQS
jgi:hypothetical protein